MRYLHLCAHEQFLPDRLLRQAVAVEAGGLGRELRPNPRLEPVA